jgi:hypothetical protein
VKKVAHRVSAVVNGHLDVRFDPVRIKGLQFAAHPFGYPHQHSKVEHGYTVLPIDL